MKKKTSAGKSILLGIIILLILIVYAYGFQVTKVGFEEISSPRRQESLTRVIRALARPDIFEYDQKETIVNTSIYVPCQDQGVNASVSDTSGPYLVLTPPCADPRSAIQIEGFNFEPDSKGPIFFIPRSEVTLTMGEFESDANGYFKVDAKLPPRPDNQAQTIRAITRQKVGQPHFSQNAIDTWGKIIETIFLALLATSFGIIFAIPVSFLAARNLMKDITTTTSSLALSLLGWPVGIAIGATVSKWVGLQSEKFSQSNLMMLFGILVNGLILYGLVRLSISQEEERLPRPAIRLVRFLAMLVASLAGIMALFLFSSLAISIGGTLAIRPGLLGLFGAFAENLGEILNLIIVSVVALAGGGITSSSFSRFGKQLLAPLSQPVIVVINVVLGALAGLSLGIFLGAGINWLYQPTKPLNVLWLLGGIGALLGILVAALNRKKDVLQIGLAIYFITRTILNALRAIEALIWVIIFVVWVGIGPFAGVLALSLHTIAALAKLYSEQVESILPGPLEAVKSTGATRLQTIIYAVIPQIVPPYISFTMYRWDINVRMSTIIGFAGGGGIGFLLLQNINLLNYRAAATQMLAIAIVVALMDYLSSYMRERVI